MKSKKTIEVEIMKDFVNKFLSESPDEKSDQRIGMALAMDEILHKTGNYRGFCSIGEPEPGFWGKNCRIQFI